MEVENFRGCCYSVASGKLSLTSMECVCVHVFCILKFITTRPTLHIYIYTTNRDMCILYFRGGKKSDKHYYESVLIKPRLPRTMYAIIHAYVRHWIMHACCSVSVCLCINSKMFTRNFKRNDDDDDDPKLNIRMRFKIQLFHFQST